MTQPLALVVYENLMPGSKLANRLQDLGYRVLTLSDTAGLPDLAEKEMPLVVVLDIVSSRNDACALIQKVKANASTAHIPVIAYASPKHTELLKAAHEAGAALVASDEAIITQLPHLLEHALALD